jgi:hypothetical protein
MTWESLFADAARYDVSIDDIRETLRTIRDG